MKQIEWITGFGETVTTPVFATFTYATTQLAVTVHPTSNDFTIVCIEAVGMIENIEKYFGFSVDNPRQTA